MISVHGLAHRYGRQEILQLAEWQVVQGERWLVLGASGSGKTTLLHALAGLIRPTSGEIWVAGFEVSSKSAEETDRWRGANVGIVLQALHLVKHLSVRDNLRLAQYLARAPQDDARIAETLDALGVGDKAARRPTELSQGEQQRVAIARAVVGQPDLLLADEPTGNVDPEIAQRLIRLFGELNRLGTTVLIATHDRGLIERSRSREMRLVDGRLVELRRG